MGSERRVLLPQERKKEVVAHVGVKKVLTLMKAHTDDIFITEAALGALRTIAFSPVVKQSLVSEGGLAMIVETMHRHPTNEEVQLRGCGALCNVSSNKEGESTPIRPRS